MATDSAPTDAGFISRLAALCGEWNRAEEWIKRVEMINGEVLAPSINELRYAGRRLVDACEARRRGEHEAARGHIQEAEQNLIKARHDVVDAVVGYISDNAGAVRERLGADQLQKHFSEYGELFHLCRAVMEKISKSRNDRTNRNADYEAMMNDDMPRLIAMYSALTESLPAIMQNIKKDSRRNLYFLIFGIAGIAVGIIGVAL